MPSAQHPTWLQTLQSYLDRRLFWVFLLSCSSGFPWVLIGSAMSGWLTDAGLTLTQIGYFGSVFAVYAVNFLWAPLIDRVELPIFCSLFGQRRGWILLCQCIILIATCCLAGVHPEKQLLLTSVIALVIASASATQDIAIDAFRIDSFPKSEPSKLPQASAMSVIGWWTGYSLPGDFAFAGADGQGWNNVFYGMAALVVLLMIMTLIVKEPKNHREALQSKAEARYKKVINNRVLSWISVTVIEPFADFFRRNGVWVSIAILLFVFLFKIGEAFLGRMSIAFYKEVGFTNAQIALLL